MGLLDMLLSKWADVEHPFLVHPKGALKFSDIASQPRIDLNLVKSGDVVAIIGDFDPQSISLLLLLIDKNVILVPLTSDTRPQHSYFFEMALVDVVIEGDQIKRLPHKNSHGLIDTLRKKNHAGLVLFSSGTTGRPKAILHDFTQFLKRFETPRPTLLTINFLLFDHIGGLNTLLHTLFNKGTVIALKSRSVEDVITACDCNNVEVLPTTPTFLRMMLMSGLIPDRMPTSLKLITYGTERMDQQTLDTLCELLPEVDFRQTFGMSELGIVRVKSESRNSLFMKVGGEGVETRIANGVLEIRSETRMLGYLNASNPFNSEGWYNTKDLVEEKNGYYKIVGRTSEVINVGGLKFMASEVERAALKYEGVQFVKAQGKSNPFTGQHVEITVQAKVNYELDKKKIKSYLASMLPRHMQPQRVMLDNISVNHRFKRS